MKARFVLIAAALTAPLIAGAHDALTSLHPEAQYPDPPAKVAEHPYSDFIRQVQEALHAVGFDAGPPNGDFGTKTQAALAQFQLSRNVPASGQLDDATLAALGVVRPQASADATREPPPSNEEEAPAS